MPKMKTNRMTYKKFRVGGKGAVKRKKAFKSHLTGKRSPKRIRQLRSLTKVSPADMERVVKMLPYIGKGH